MGELPPHGGSELRGAQQSGNPFSQAALRAGATRPAAAVALATGSAAAATARVVEATSPERTRSTTMPAPQAKAPPPRIFPGLGQLDAAHTARARGPLGGVAYRGVSPPSAPISGSTVSPTERHG
eukprot:4788907-Alexandrium_andersonii.AAC.1